jgi:hypothetical protein
LFHYLDSEEDALKIRPISSEEEYNKKIMAVVGKYL